ncbi:uncharacterized protein LTHEOB_8617 [Lasiodiplodia theobromae]|uniref:uncharacterized protein n=1 Tax=Lasiodiplodia theobromae TaxID=45133 RepID=UPI0015C3C715|nr:uncharacterized protein LTHEOB_8617 [Lasiodiplodia theobromae]KAF4541622.1 hypothetical protein LTHEOB_8617 [Lasiodiplodia theobromae]
MQAANRFQKALKKGGTTFGAWQMLPGSNLSRAIASADMDWICLDMEHGNIDDGQMHECVAAVAGCGVSPVVRIAANETWMVKHDARKLVSSAKFPPQGKRGFSPELAIGKFASKRTGDYLLQANDALVTIAQIETKEALDNVDEIAAVPGIDVLFIGPFDLANDIGHPIIGGIMHDELKAAFDRIYKAATDNGKWAGIYCNNGTEGHEYAQKGFHMVSIGADLVDIPSHFDNALCMARGEGVIG